MSLRHCFCLSFFFLLCASSSQCYINVFPPSGDLQEIYYISTLSPCDKQIHLGLPSRAATFLLCLINVAYCFTCMTTDSKRTKSQTESILRYLKRKHLETVVKPVYYADIFVISKRIMLCTVGNFLIIYPINSFSLILSLSFSSIT